MDARYNSDAFLKTTKGWVSLGLLVGPCMLHAFTCSMIVWKSSLTASQSLVCLRTPL